MFPGKLRWVWLLVASVAYYISFVPSFVSLLGALVICNYFGGRWLFEANESGGGKRVLVVMVLSNILILCFFKYFNFIFPNINADRVFVDWFYRSDRTNSMIVPIGLSYLIFGVISYNIEIKRKNIAPELHLGYFTLYLMFFPRITQGPIERPQKLLPQLREVHPFKYDNLTFGMKLIIWGYFKKLVVADRLAIYVNSVYNNSEHHNGTTLLVATVFFTFQIYADFSGYTDIALGSAQLFGISLTENFKRPYLAISIKDFWNRWHITFSTWLRDYLFLPLAFYISTKLKKDKYLFLATEKWIYFVSIIITFAICGLWHGEGWNYLIWGLLLGILLTYSNWTEKLNKKIRKLLNIRKTDKIYIIYKVLLTFCLISLTWIFFRSSTVHEASKIVEKIFTNWGHLYIMDYQNILFCIMGIIILLLTTFIQEYKTKNNLPYISNSWLKEQFVYALIIVMILVSGVFDGDAFLYTKF